MASSYDQLPAPSILDDLGEEVTGIMAPVSLCMAITVLLVRLLNPDGTGASANAVVIASLAYDENTSDSSGKKFTGALLNAVIFASIMAGMTFILVLLFKYGCFRIIYVYMAFAVFDIFFLITSIVAVQVLQVLNIHMDAISFILGLYNFAVVGTVGVLFIPIPLLAKQGYMLWTGVITAYIFTWVPEWTSWVLICVMALYDIAAVLIPGGPLNLLVKVAMERQEMLPALVYEARPTRGPYVPNALRRRGGGSDGTATNDVESARPSAAALINYSTLTGSSIPIPIAGGARADEEGQVAYLPPDAVAAARQQSPAQRHAEGRPGSARAALAGPIITGGSASVSPLPHAAGGSRPPSASSQQQKVTDSSPRHSSGGRRATASNGGDGTTQQEMMSSSRFAPSYAGQPAADGSNVFIPPQSTSGAAGAGRPLGEGKEDQTWAALPGHAAGDSPAGHGMGPLAVQSNSMSGRLHPLGGAAWNRDAEGLAAASPGSSQALLAAYPQPSSDGATGQPGQVMAAGQEGANGMSRGDAAAPAHGDGHGAVHDTAASAATDSAQVAIELPDSIKLGLGDFIFYSMLVGRAAMYDYMTVFASYLGIVAGLGLTLLCLAFYQKALPALPFSIALGVLFYFLTRLVLEPFLVPLATTLTYY